MVTFGIYTRTRRSLLPLRTPFYRFYLYLMALCLSVIALPVNSQLPSQSDALRIKKLENSLLSPCCYGEPVSRHMSQISFQIRKEIEDKVRAGQSDREILDYYKQLYGERVLLEPEGTKRTALYLVPILIAAAGFISVLLFLRYSLHAHRVRDAANLTKDPLDARIAEVIRRATEV